MRKAYSYLRFSTPEQAKGDSYRRQISSAAEYAERHGLLLDEKLTFRDLGVSAFRGRNAREGQLGDFLELVRLRVVEEGSFLLVESLDRISRDSIRRALRTLEDIVEAGVTVVTLADGRAYTEENLNALEALMSAVMVFARANDESAMKGARTRAAWANKRARASEAPLTKVCPAWLKLRPDRSGFDAIPERADVVRRIYEMAATGTGHHAIASTLNAEGVPTFGDERRKPAPYWHRTYIAKILGSPAAMGTYVPHTTIYERGRTRRVPQEPVHGYYPAVVDAETASRARLVSGPGENPRRGRHASSPVRNVLAGLARCPACGGTMTRVSKGSRSKAGKPYLVCAKAKAGAGCEYRALSLQQVEDALRLRADELVYKRNEDDRDPELEEWQRELAGLSQASERYSDAVAAGAANPILYARLAEVGARHRELEAIVLERLALREATREPLVARRLEELRAFLKAEPFDPAAANTALRLAAESVEVDHLSGLLNVKWRHGETTDIVFAWPADEGPAETAAGLARRAKAGSR